MKIKNVLMLLSAALFLAGCSWLFYEKNQVFNDEFKNSRTVIARLTVNADERRTEINRAKIVVERELFDNNELCKAYFVISRSSSSFIMGKTGFIQIDKELFEITTDEIVSEYKSDVVTSTSTYTTTDSSSVSVDSKTDSDTRFWIVDKFKVSFTPEMTAKIAIADKITIRFYFGPIPATFIVKGQNLDLLKEIFQQ